VRTLSDLPITFLTSAGGYSGISLSIVTPPRVTLATLREAKTLGIKRVWMQPGAWDWECVYDEQAGVNSGAWDVFLFGGEEEEDMNPGAEEGWCVLVHGEEGMRQARRKGGMNKESRERVRGRGEEKL